MIYQLCQNTHFVPFFFFFLSSLGISFSIAIRGTISGNGLFSTSVLITLCGYSGLSSCPRIKIISSWRLYHIPMKGNYLQNFAKTTGRWLWKIVLLHQISKYALLHFTGTRRGFLHYLLFRWFLPQILASCRGCSLSPCQRLCACSAALDIGPE